MPTQAGTSGGVFWEEQQLLGKTVGQYEVRSFLGRGGTAMVFKVLDLETGTLRALKMTAAEPTDAELHRFKREFRVMSRLAHPNVIAVYRYGVHETRPYFVMELIEGRDLRSYLRGIAEQPGYYERVAGTIAQVCRALAYIHDRHIIHRDLKPGNILVTDEGLAKVMDFGIAFEIDVTARHGRAHTLMGTLAYVSPEQATGRKVDARSDLYSLGIILYELLTGAKPFTGQTLSQVVYKHLHELPKPPGELNPKAPEALCTLTLQLLAKRAHERPQAAQEVLVALEAFLAGDRAREIEGAAIDLIPEAPPLNEPRFVGRERVMEALRGRVANLKKGRGALVLICGEPGIGKSRLIEEFCRDDGLSDVQVFSSRCLAQATSPYQGFRTIVSAAVERLAEAPGGLEEILTPLQASVLVKAFPDLEAVLKAGEARGPLPSGGSPEWLNLFTAVRAVLEKLTDLAPVVLTFDDLDRADEASLALLQALVRTLVAGSRPRRLLILGAARPEAVGGPAGRGAAGSAGGASSMPALAGGYSGRLQSLIEIVGFAEPPLVSELELLTVAQVEEMIRSMLGHAEDPEGLADYVQQQSDGNPFFIDAILRALVAQGGLIRREHSVTGFEWTLHLEKLEPQVTTLAVPAGLQGALRKRLAVLDPKDLMLLQMAATIGEPFSYELLRDLTQVDEDALLDFLDRMLKAHLLTERPGEGQAAYDFTHGRARELIVGDLPRQEQVLLHQRVGQVLASRQDDALAAVTAAHLYEGRLYDEALPFLIQAGERFAAQQLFRLALRPLSLAREILERYRVPLEGRDDTPLKMRVDHALGTALRGLGRSEEAFEHLSLALAAVQERPNHAVEAEIRTALGHVHREKGEYRAAREHYEAAASRLRRAGQSHRAGDTLLGLGEILSRQGLVMRALEVYAETRDLSLELQHKPGLAGALLGLGDVALVQGNTQEALRRLNEALGIFRWLEDRPAVIQTLGALGELHRIQGRYEQALETLEEAMLAAREYDLRSKLAALTGVLGELYLDLNVPTQVEGLLSEGLGLCARHNYIFHRAALCRLWGVLKERQNELSAALDAYRSGLKLAQGISASVLTARLLADVARLQLQLEEVAGARRLIDKAVGDLRQAGAMYAFAEAQLVAGQIRLEEGDLEGAHAAVHEAVTQAERMEARDLYFRALVARMEMPPLPDGASRNAGLLRAAGTLFRLIEGAGPRWQGQLLRRPEIRSFLAAHPAFTPKEPPRDPSDTESS